MEVIADAVRPWALVLTAEAHDAYLQKVGLRIVMRALSCIA